MAKPVAASTKECRAFVIGWPIDHSRSPLIHNYWIKQYDLKGSYDKISVPPTELGQFLTSLSECGLVGGNITIPHKSNALQFVTDTDEKAKTLGAINTVWIAEGRLIGTNTDGYGFLANLDDRSPGWDHGARKSRGALVLGAGGASRAIIYGLVERGFSPVFISNRTHEKAEHLARKFGASCRAVYLNQLGDIAASVSLIVNTTSLGMGDEATGELPLNLDGVADDVIVHDIVYTPLTTPFLADADQRGLHTIDGLGMLLHQAVPGFEKWFGIRPEVTRELRQVLLDDLGESEND